MVQDIINLKKQVNLLEDDATEEKMRDWYSYALSNGLVELEYAGGKLQGFLEWGRLNYIPKNKYDARFNYDTIKTAPILLAINAIALSKKVLHNLRTRVRNKNRDVLYFCWHDKKRDLMRNFKNIRRNN